jgi:alpha-glucosidase
MTNKSLWWKTGVIYQIYPRSFHDSTGNGVGDLPGITQKLPYLASDLGVDAVWLSPFYKSPMADFGYDVEDYRDVDPLFGTLADFDCLLDTAHQVGLKVIIDLVPNHTSDRHTWFRESRSSRENPKRDWYIWADPGSDGGPPNNWLSVFGGSAWEWDDQTGQYYLHSFLKEQPDLNWRNPAVKDAIFDVTRFWLERGVDGFRIDVAHYILKDPEMRDNPPNPTGGKSIHKPLGEYDSQFHIYDKGHPDVHDIYREFRDLLDSYSTGQPRVSIGEIHIFDWTEWASYYGNELDEIHLPYNFSLLGAEWEASDFRRLVGELESVLPEGAWPNYVLGTHDDHRLASRFGQQQARVAAMLLLTLRGTPTLYYGDEIGMMDSDVPPELAQDPAGFQDPSQGRDPNRSPMQWSAEENAGFSPPGSSAPWLPIAEDYRTRNLESQQQESRSIYHLYRSLLQIRGDNPALQTGTYREVNGYPASIYAYSREDSGNKFLILLNFSPDSRQISLQEPSSGEILISTYLDREGPIQGTLTLRSLEGIIISL